MGLDMNRLCMSAKALHIHKNMLLKQIAIMNWQAVI